MKKIPSEMEIAVHHLPTNTLYVSIKQECNQELYDEVRAGMEKGFAYLWLARSEDRKVFFSADVLKDCVIEVRVTAFKIG